MSVTFLRRARLVPVFLMLCFGVQFAQAQQPSQSASGNSTVQATVPSGRFLISGITDLNLGEWDGIGDESLINDSICVWATDREYALTIKSDTTAFELTSTATTDKIPFLVEWQAHSAANSLSVNHNVPLESLQALSKTKDCSDGTSMAKMTVTMKDAALAAAKAASYKAILTITVSAL